MNTYMLTPACAARLRAALPPCRDGRARRLARLHIQTEIDQGRGDALELKVISAFDPWSQRVVRPQDLVERGEERIIITWDETTPGTFGLCLRPAQPESTSLGSSWDSGWRTSPEYLPCSCGCGAATAMRGPDGQPWLEPCWQELVASLAVR